MAQHINDNIKADCKFTIPPKVLVVLCRMYKHVDTLESVLTRLSSNEVHSIICDTDKSRYRAFLKKTLVCSSKDLSSIPMSQPGHHTSYMSEIAVRVIERLRRKESSNVLTYGFTQMTSDTHTEISSSQEIEYSYPSENMNALMMSSWKQLLSRVGDDVMMLLIENHAIYIPISRNCYRQITGVPLYSLTSREGSSKSAPHSLLYSVSRTPSQTGQMRGDQERQPRSCSFKKAKCKKKKTKEFNKTKEKLKKLPKRTELFLLSKPEEKMHNEPLNENNCPLNVSGSKRLCGVEDDSGRRYYKRQRLDPQAVTIIANKKPNPYVQYSAPSNRAAVFYAKVLNECFPKSFILDTVAVDEDGFKELRRQIQSTRLTPKMQPAGDTAGCDGEEAGPDRVLSYLRLVIRNHRKCPYKTILRKNCSYDLTPLAIQPASESDVGKEACPAKHYPYSSMSMREETLSEASIVTNETSLNSAQLLEKFTHYRQVWLFVRGCCIRVLPRGLLGSKSNLNIFLHNLKAFIGAGRFDRFSLGQIMQGIKSEECGWAEDTSDRKLYVAKLLGWLLNVYIINLLRSYFYITETAPYKNKVFYYRKPLWRILQEKALSDCVGQDLYRPVAKDDVVKKLKQGQVLGVSYLRFLPKLRSLRPVVNMGKKPSGGLAVKSFSVNTQLRGLQASLTFLKEQNPDIIGRAQFGLDDVFQAVLKFTKSWKTSDERRELYFVAVDISGCYESILQDKLLDICKQLFLGQTAEKEYVIRRFASVMLSGGQVKKRFHNAACGDSTFTPDLSKFIQQQRKPLHTAILIDQVVHQHELARDLYNKLCQHVQNTVVQVGDRLYRQTRGISQGATVSTMLCNLYYAHMEQEHFDLDPSCDLLMRQVDDFLLITPSLHRARNFLNKMTAGIPEYNCKVNTNKSFTNFPAGVAAHFLQQPSPFPWCGLSIDQATLDIHPEYARYAGQDLGDSQSLDMTSHPMKHLQEKLTLTLDHKCHRIFLSLEINSENSVASNVYLAFLLTSFKLHRCMKKLPRHDWPQTHPHSITELIYHTSSAVYHRLLSAQGVGNLHKMTENLCKASIDWLCIKAFVVKLSQHQGSYHLVLSHLYSTRSSLQSLLGSEVVDFIEKSSEPGLPKEFQLAQ